MDNYSKIYWLTRLSHLQGMCIFLIVISVIFSIIYGIAYASEYPASEKKKFIITYSKYKKYVILTFVLSLLFIMFLPTKCELIEIYAGGKTMDFIQSDSSINKIPSQTTKIITNFLQKEIDSVQHK